jgi:hypothetical protein
MSQSTREEYILTNGNEYGAVERAFEWLQQEWSDPDNRDTVIAVPSKRNLEGIEDRLAPLIGERSFRSIHSSDNYAELGKGVTLHTMTERIHPSRWGGGPVLGLFVDDDQLEDIDELQGVTSVLVVPWLRGDVGDWEDRWSPEVIEFTPD